MLHDGDRRGRQRHRPVRRRPALRGRSPRHLGVRSTEVPGTPRHRHPLAEAGLAPRRADRRPGGDQLLPDLRKLAHEDGTKVLLSGQGADELFAGYRWHRAPS